MSIAGALEGPGAQMLAYVCTYRHDRIICLQLGAASVTMKSNA